jgi:hypothetical protein
MATFGVTTRDDAVWVFCRHQQHVSLDCALWARKIPTVKAVAAGKSMATIGIFLRLGETGTQ